MRPVCCGCAVEMRCSKNGRCYLERDHDNTPVNLWHMDEYKCPECGIKILSGAGALPVTSVSKGSFLHEVAREKRDNNLIDK